MIDKPAVGSEDHARPSDVFRSCPSEIRMDAPADGVSGRVMTGHFAVFNTWTTIRSVWEGEFLERLAPGAFTKTLRENAQNVRVLLNHGSDPEVGDKPIGRIRSVEEDDHGVRYEVELFPSVPPLVVDGLREGQYGASFRFRVMREQQDNAPGRSDHNPDGLPERTITELQLHEFGPVTFPAYPEATAGVRSLTDQFIVAKHPELAGQLRAAEATNPAGTAGTPASTPEPLGHHLDQRQTNTEKGGSLMENPTVEEIEARQAEIAGDLAAIDENHQAEALTDEARAEWDKLNAEHKHNQELLVELRERRDRVRAVAVDSTRQEAGFNVRPQAVRGDDIWDLSTMRANTFADPEAARAELQDRARRAIDGAVFPNDRVRNEDAQEHVSRLLERDVSGGEFAQLVLRTGSPVYRSAFAKTISGRALTQDEQRAFTLSTTGIPVPYTLDPTVIPVSNSVVNPLRAISSVEQIVGSNEWRGTTAGAITASRASEATEASDNSPTLAQPTIVCSKVQAFIPFSIESGQDWGGLEATMTRLLADAKDDEEATSFATGNGTPPAPFGVLTGATGTTGASTGLTITAGNLGTLEAALAPRWRPRAQFVANRAMYNVIRNLDTQGGAQLWLRIGDALANSPASAGGNGNTGYSLLGYPANELSTMAGTITNGTKIMLLGDFSMFKIIDRVGMQIDLIPHLFGGTNRYPTGQRGLYAYWRNGSKVLDANAFRALTGTT